MGFEKGNSLGGRKKGSINRTTAELRDAITSIVSDSVDELINDLTSLDPETRIRLVIQLLDFVLPKPKQQISLDAVEMPLFPDEN